MKKALLLTATLFGTLTAFAEPAPATAEKSAAPDAGEAKADDGWKEVSALMTPPRPKTREEAKEAYKTYLTEWEEKSAAWIKAHPEDARRWELKAHELKLRGMRQFAGLEEKSEDEMKALLKEILGAEDAGKEVKSMASFIQVTQAQDNEEEFKKLAAAHKEAYPDFRGNQQLDMMLKKAEASKAIKEKPLELAFKATDGTEVDITKMRGKVVLIDFWATWCGPCVAEIPNVVGTYKKLHEKGFEIIGISFDQDADKLAAMTKEKEMPWAQYFDGEGWQNKFGQQWGITGIPTMWLVDKKGMVVDTNGRQDLEKKVEKLLAE